MANPYRTLERRIGYRFRRRARLDRALTHRSFRFEQAGVDEDNQRLEYLGDAALGLAAAAFLFERFPLAKEGELTQRRSEITSTRALAETARALDLGAYLRLGRGESRAGGSDRDTTLADTLEAVLGAAFVDGGQKAVTRIFRAVFEDAAVGGEHRPSESNPKGHLQEVCERQWKEKPRYELVEEAGPLHARRFRVRVRLGDRVLAEGAGPNKRAAETEAARCAVHRLAGDEPA